MKFKLLRSAGNDTKKYLKVLKEHFDIQGEENEIKTIEVNSIDELIKLLELVDNPRNTDPTELIIGKRTRDKNEIPYIEIYDSYRE